MSRARFRRACPRMAAGTVALALLGLGCQRATPVATAPAARHLVLISIDTLRADRLGCYGGDVATPHLDRLAREGTFAPQATVHAPLTRPSHASLFTGLLPPEHGIRDNVSPALLPDFPTLAETLRQAGFDTAAFVSSVVLASQSGLDRGFDRYDDRFEGDADDARFLNTVQKPGDRTTADAVAWLEARGARRSFVFLHLYDPHDPWEPPEPYASRYAGRPYDGEVAFSDELVGRLDAALARLGRRDDTLVVVTSDHGEGLGEHGEMLHGYFVYESTLRVPLIVRGPGVGAGGRLDVTAQTVDLFPTLLELLGVPPPPGPRPGRSLAPALRDGARLAEAPAYAESLVPLLHFGWSDLRALREGRFKYIQAPRPELYDLRDDPGETRNLLAEQPARAEALRAALAPRLELERRSGAATAGATGVPADLLEKLGALGYLGPGAPAHSAAPGADPKDKLDEFKLANGLTREGLVRLREGDHAGSAERFRELLSRGIASFATHYYLARSLVGLKRYAEAAAQFEAALRYQPAFAAAHVSLAECRVAAGDLRGALRALERGRAAAPEDPGLLVLEGGVWVRLKDRARAIRAYEAAAALAPKHALVRVRLGELHRDAGDTLRAVARLREAVALEPGQASYWNALGMVLGGSGDLPGAERAFRAALERAPRDAEYAYNLGLAIQRQGRDREAAGYFEQALALDPRFAPARERLAEAARH